VHPLDRPVRASGIGRIVEKTIASMLTASNPNTASVCGSTLGSPLHLDVRACDLSAVGGRR
jgi:hypothetical protein